MIPLRRIIRDLFGFSRAQVNAFVLLLPIMFLVLFSHPLYRLFQKDRPVFSLRDSAMLDSLVATLEYDSIKMSPEKKRVRHFFKFDPNLAKGCDLDSLGFSESLSARIINYRQKGGTFRVKSDLLKIYGVDTSFYQSLYFYIQLPEKIERKQSEFKKAEVAHFKKAEHFDLNLADTAHLKRINGIGEKLALRIIRYRDALGGFVDMQQLNEVYGLDSVVVNRVIKNSFIDNTFPLQKININQATEKDLSSHPYLSRPVAKAIISYRFQHGYFHDADELQNISILSAEAIQKLSPYIEFNKE